MLKHPRRIHLQDLHSELHLEPPRRKNLHDDGEKEDHGRRDVQLQHIRAKQVITAVGETMEQKVKRLDGMHNQNPQQLFR